MEIAEIRRSGFEIDAAEEEADNGEEDGDPQNTIHEVIGLAIYQMLDPSRMFQAEQAESSQDAVC